MARSSEFRVFTTHGQWSPVSLEAAVPQPADRDLAALARRGERAVVLADNFADNHAMTLTARSKL